MFLNISFRVFNKAITPRGSALLAPYPNLTNPRRQTEQLQTPVLAAPAQDSSCGRTPNSPHPAGNHSPGVTQPTFRATYTADIFTLYFLLQCLSLSAITALLNAKLNSQNPCPSFFQHAVGSQHTQSLLSGKAPNNFCTINFIYWFYLAILTFNRTLLSSFVGYFNVSWTINSSSKTFPKDQIICLQKYV